MNTSLYRTIKVERVDLTNYEKVVALYPVPKYSSRKKTFCFTETRCVDSKVSSELVGYAIIDTMPTGMRITHFCVKNNELHLIVIKELMLYVQQHYSNVNVNGLNVTESVKKVFLKTGVIFSDAQENRLNF